MSALNAQTRRPSITAGGCIVSFCSESLEQRALFAVSLDLSLQGAYFDPSNSNAHPALVAPFRIDAAHVSTGPFSGGVRIDGSPVLAVPRIDGPPTGIQTSVPPTNSHLFQQIDSANSRPFERPTTEITGKPGEHITPATPNAAFYGEGSTPFDVFENVNFTFAGGHITAELPVHGKLLDINIAVNYLPGGMHRLSGPQTGHGNFYARLGLFDYVKDGQPTPGGNDPLSIPPTRPGSPVPPTSDNGVVPPSSQPPLAEVPSAPEQPANPAKPPSQAEVPVAARADAPVHHVQVRSAATKLATADHGTQVITLGAGEAPTVTTVAITARLETAQSASASTTVLLDGVFAESGTGSAIYEATRYAVVAGSTQLSTLAAAATKFFGSAAPQGGEIVGESDVEFFNADISGDLLGLSPWRMAVSQNLSATRYAWGITAGVSLVVAVGGYWYCQEYIARQRQALKVRPAQPARAPIKSLSTRYREEMA